jgi:hypothetical protein
MRERRMQRSSDRYEAVQLLLGAVAPARVEMEGKGIALVDDRGRLLAGSGSPRQMWAVARVAQGRAKLDGHGFVSRRIASPEGSMTLAAIGVHQGHAGIGGAAEGVARILRMP